MKITCEICHTEFNVRGERKHTARFCSIACKAEHQHLYVHGENHPRWTVAERSKVCEYCGETFVARPTEAISSFTNRRFCSHTCGWIGQTYYSGKDNVNWTGAARTRDYRHVRWADSVIRRDKAVCQKCGATGIEMHAHHLNSYIDHTELRYDQNNGVTLCCYCHWDEHSATIENGVNSGNNLPSNVGVNPEPSLNGNILEGATTNGRAYRRINCNCDWCGTFLSIQLSKAKGKQRHFCDKKCMGKYNSKYKVNIRYGSNSDTSAPPERDDIV